MMIKTVLVCLFVAALGIAVAVAGFAADAKKPKRSQLTVVFVGPEPKCDYPSSPTMGIALAATAALVIAHTVITASTGGCCSCCRSFPTASKFARVCIVTSWITSSIAVILFLIGAKISGQKGVEIDVHGVFYCYTLRPGVFSAAGIIGLVSVLLGLVYYFLYVLAQRRATKTSEGDLQLEKPSVTVVRKTNNK